MTKYHLHIIIKGKTREVVMAITISVALEKGGIGKTTTSENLSACLGAKGKKVLLVDMDSQANATFASGAEAEYSIVDALTGACDINKVVFNSKYYDLLASDNRLANIESMEIDLDFLKKMLAPFQKKYDFIIIDTPPALGNLLKASLMASDYCLIPTEPRPFAINGIAALCQTIQAIQAKNKKLKVLGILLIKYSSRTNLNKQLKEVLEDLANQMGTILFERTIREAVCVAEAQTMQLPLIDYAPNAKPTIDYKGLATDILELLEA